MRDILRGMVLLLALVLCSSPAFGQASSTSYTLVTGTFVATGGVAVTTSGTTVTASIPTTIGGVSSSPSYIVSSGVIGVAYVPALRASYSGSAVQTVTPADQLLKVRYAGGFGTATGTLRYRYGGNVTFSSATMTPGTADTLQYNLQASTLGIRGLEYYFEVSRGGETCVTGSSSNPYAFRVTLTNEQCRSDHLGNRTYNIVGVPLAISGGNAVADVFADDLGAYDNTEWRLGRWNPATESYQEYPNLPAVVPGRGYWVIVRSDTDFGAAGTSLVPNQVYGTNRYISIPLEQGWNQIANPFPFPVSMLEVVLNDNGTMTTDPTGVIEPEGHYYNGSAYFTQITYDPWDGVFLWAEKAGVDLWIRYHAAGSTKPIADGLQIARSVPAWQLELVMEAGDKADMANYAGVCVGAANGADAFDRHEPPVAPEGVGLAFKLPDGDEHLRRTDYREELGEGATWEVVLSKGLDRVVKVNGIESIPDGKEAWLIPQPGQMVRLEEEGQAIALANDVSTARLVIGTAAYVAGEAAGALPQEFALSQNFPNPFNPSTTLRFALPKASHVEMKIYNMLGQKVATLVNGDMDAGHHMVIWDGRSDQGNQVASGVYFYRIEADNFTATKKMTLLK